MNQYKIVVAPLTAGDDEEQSTGFLARAPEIPGCEATGETRAEALSNLEQELEAQLENMEEEGVAPPAPLATQDYDGKLTISVSPRLHRDLVFMAREGDVELSLLLTELLTRAVTMPAGRPRQGGQQGRRGRPPRKGAPHGDRYHNIMENRADFIEYVRGLENGGESGGGRGRGGRGRSRR